MKFLYSADDIAEKLPHKYPLLLVDLVLEFVSGQSITCIKNVTQNEEFFVGHFPQRKIMPGVLICEALAQTCALYGILDADADAREPLDVAVRSGGKPEIGYLTAVNVKFLRPVVPGDQLVLTARAGKALEGIRMFDVEAAVERETACKGNIKVTVRGGAKHGG